VNKKFQKSFFLLSNEKTFSDGKSNKRHAIGPLTDFVKRRRRHKKKERKKGDEKRDEKKVRSFFALL